MNSIIPRIIKINSEIEYYTKSMIRYRNKINKLRQELKELTKC